MSLFITFEGVEGSGKSTQIAYLARYLEKRGYKVLKTREPGGTKFGEKIRRILLYHSLPISVLSELFLIMAQRIEHVEKVIIPAIKEGKIVLCDRFIDATYAYQGYGRGIDISLIDQLHRMVFKDLRPDLTILIDCDIDLSLKRKGIRYDRFEIESREFHERVRDGYLKIAQSFPERIKILDGTKSKKELKGEIKKIVDGFLGEHGL